MKIFYTLILITYSLTVSAICVHEREVSGLLLNTKELESLFNVHVQLNDHFIPLNEFKLRRVNKNVKYVIQYFDPSDILNTYEDIIPYYQTADINKFLAGSDRSIQKSGYKRVSVGKSILGKDLWGILPQKIDRSKTTIIMFGRQHGDESTANWIIEGFLKEVFQTNPSWLDQYQLIVYPMINPDGADKKTRYNANRFDLNRSWATLPSKAKDEAKTILTHLYKIDFLTLKNAVVLDMHGSFTKDFIYTVKKRFINLSFFKIQKSFVDQLKKYDPFQKGTHRTSNGNKGMARIVLSQQFRLNALTHETPRSISKKNSYYRTLGELKQQGVALKKVISDLY